MEKLFIEPVESSHNPVEDEPIGEYQDKDGKDIDDWTMEEIMDDEDE